MLDSRNEDWGWMPVETVSSRLEWREQMDRNLRRLLKDGEITRSCRDLEATTAHRLRSGHLDKMYDWYRKHGAKEVHKEREGPSFLQFDEDGPAMPGSLRGLRGQRGPTGPSRTPISRAQSLPQLTVSPATPLAQLPFASCSDGAKQVAGFKEDKLQMGVKQVAALKEDKLQVLPQDPIGSPVSRKTSALAPSQWTPIKQRTPIKRTPKEQWTPNKHWTPVKQGTPIKQVTPIKSPGIPTFVTGSRAPRRSVVNSGWDQTSLRRLQHQFSVLHEDP